MCNTCNNCYNSCFSTGGCSNSGWGCGNTCAGSNNGSGWGGSCGTSRCGANWCFQQGFQQGYWTCRSSIDSGCC